MENESHALAAGIFTISSALPPQSPSGGWGRATTSTTTYLLETRGNVTGLNVQAQVRYRGIRAGKVRPSNR
jgi:phospholipid/cholesterol/gamma-HCH transport system substrate-binding protein